MYLDHLQNWLVYGRVLLIFVILALFWLSETGQIWGFQAFWSCSVDFPHYGDPLAEIGHILGFLGIIWRTCGSKCRGEGGGIFPTLCVECCLVSQGSMDLNTLRSRQNGHHFQDNIFKYIFLNKNPCILITISLKFASLGPISNIPSSVQIMTWRQSGDKPLSGTMMALFTNTYMRHWASVS